MCLQSLFQLVNKYSLTVLILAEGIFQDYTIPETSTGEETADLVSSALKAAVDESF